MKEFADSVLPDVDHYFVGHFHLDKFIEVDGCKSVLQVVPDWLSQRKVLRVSEHGEIEVLRYQNGSLGSIRLSKESQYLEVKEVEFKDFFK